MRYPDNRIMFTVNEVSKACGISRATLLRMEESGFLKPYHIDPDSGYRYYDADNITQIGQYQLFMDLGLSRKEAADLYYHWGHLDTEGLLTKQKLRINRLQRLLNELEMKYEHTKDFSFSFIEMPETTCICESFKASSFEECETLAYSLAQNVIKEGFKVHVTEPLFLLLSEVPQEPSLLCFPVVPTNVTDPRLKTFPACYAFSVLAHGDYSVVHPLIQFFKEKFSALNLKAAGQPRIIALVAPYTGEHICRDDYCFECVIPIVR